MTEQEEEWCRKISKAVATGKGMRTAGVVGKVTTGRVFRIDQSDYEAGLTLAHWWKEKFKKELVMKDCCITETNGDEILYLMSNGYVIVFSPGIKEVWETCASKGGVVKIDLVIPGKEKKDEVR